jgi:hypothetical protein
MQVHYNSIYPAGEVPRQGVERVAQLEAAAAAEALAAAGSPRVSDAQHTAR